MRLGPLIYIIASRTSFREKGALDKLAFWHPPGTLLKSPVLLPCCRGAPSARQGSWAGHLPVEGVARCSPLELKRREQELAMSGQQVVTQGLQWPPRRSSRAWQATGHVQARLDPSPALLPSAGCCPSLGLPACAALSCPAPLGWEQMLLLPVCRVPGSLPCWGPYPSPCPGFVWGPKQCPMLALLPVTHGACARVCDPPDHSAPGSHPHCPIFSLMYPSCSKSINSWHRVM